MTWKGHHEEHLLHNGSFVASFFETISDAYLRITQRPSAEERNTKRTVV
jgi:hypothetical protein